MGNNPHKKIDVLMREYELHRQELLLQIELYNRQTKYIQIYGTFLLALMAFLLGIRPERVITWLGEGQIYTDRSGGIIQITSLSIFIVLVFLILAAAIVFYLVSTVMASSYMFLILRRRMALIEHKVNALLQSPGLLEYEARVTQHFLENKSYGDYHVTPHLLSGVWRGILFGSVIAILDWIAIQLLPHRIGWPFFIVLTSFAIIQVTHYVLLYRNRSKETINEFIFNPEASPKKIRFCYFLIFAVVFLLLVLIPYFLFCF